MATCATDSNGEMQHHTDENTLKTEHISEDGASTSLVVSTKDSTTKELTDGWQIDRNLGDCILHMFDAQLWTDVTFRCADQSEEMLDDIVHAHKIVLAARSPVFQAMFFGPLRDTSEEIKIQYAEGGKFKTFLRLLYSDNVDLINEVRELTDSLEMSHKYQVQFLVDGCCRKLAERISVENSCWLLDRALLYENQYLIDQVSDFIDRNATKVLVTDGYLQMSLRCLTYILKGDTFHANEAEIFNITIEWARRKCESTDGQKLRETLGGAFYFLRTPMMTISEFGACTKRKGFYSIEEQEDFTDIIDRIETSKVKLDCNYKRKRYPRTLVVTRPVVARKDSLANSSISESISLFVEENVFLSNIKLTNFTSAYPTNQVYNTSLRNINVPFVLKKAPLVVSLKVDGVLIPGKYTQISGDTPSILTLKTPYSLISGRTYTLQAEIHLDVVEKLPLQARRCDYSGDFTGIRKDIIRAQTTSKIKDNAELIQSLSFNCKSNRE